MGLGPWGRQGLGVARGAEASVCTRGTQSPLLLQIFKAPDTGQLLPTPAAHKDRVA